MNLEGPDFFARCWRGFVEAARRLPPVGTSEAWLLEMLERNARTDMGRRYGFSGIKSVADYQKKVPLHDYEAIAPLVERMARGEEDVLFAGRAAAFERTSGSTGLNGNGAPRADKLIPYSRESLEDFRRLLLPWLAALVEKYEFSGKAYWSISPALRGPTVTEAGLPIGLADWNYLGAEAEEAFSGLSAVPPWAGALEDYSVWRTVTLYYLLRSADLCFIFLWSPSFFLQLVRGLAEEARQLLFLLQNGGSLGGHSLPPAPDAAERLQKYFENGETRTLWPGPLVISAWADAWAAGFAEELTALMPQAHLQPKGLLCTEGVVSVPDETGRALAVAGHGFLEFADESGQIRLAYEMRPGESYRVIMTTSGGLYRYFSGDMVRCAGHVAGRAAVRFAGRFGLCCDLAGEKLTDAFAASCLEGIMGFSMLQPLRLKQAAYRLLLDSSEHSPEDAVALARRVDGALRKNPQYAYARQMGQLGEVVPLLLDNPAGRYLAWALPRSGGRHSVLKFPSLCANVEFQPV